MCGRRRGLVYFTISRLFYKYAGTIWMPSNKAFYARQSNADHAIRALPLYSYFNLIFALYQDSIAGLQDSTYRLIVARVPSPPVNALASTPLDMGSLPIHRCSLV